VLFFPFSLYIKSNSKDGNFNNKKKYKLFSVGEKEFIIFFFLFSDWEGFWAEADLAAVMDYHILCDPHGVLSTIICDLGNTYLHAGFALSYHTLIPVYLNIGFLASSTITRLLRFGRSNQVIQMDSLLPEEDFIAKTIPNLSI
jgi:hypothetical protein